MPQTLQPNHCRRAGTVHHFGDMVAFSPNMMNSMMN
jgi:hypothetical protein